jgi:hypothetical protein
VTGSRLTTKRLGVIWVGLAALQVVWLYVFDNYDAARALAVGLVFGTTLTFATLVLDRSPRTFPRKR